MLTPYRPALSLPSMRLPTLIAAILKKIPSRTSQASRSPRAQRLHADELRSMSDLDLKDLGIGRSEIGYLLEQEAQRK